jgi:dienelactone hydrolase
MRTGAQEPQRSERIRAPMIESCQPYNSRMLAFWVMPLMLAFTTLTAVHTIFFPTQDGGRVCADLYGQGSRAVVLAHGGRFNKESWREQAEALAAQGFRILAIDFRGFGCSTGPGQANFDNAPFDNDVIAAVRYLKERGAKSVSVVGGSFGGAAAGDASIKSPPGEIDRIVFLGAAPNLSADKLKSRSLFIVAREDHNDSGARLPRIRVQYEMAPRPKELIVLEGSAHAQFLFQTDQNTRVMNEIVRFLSMP